MRRITWAIFWTSTVESLFLRKVMLQLEICEAKQKLRRLTEMPSREIAHRVRERLYWNLERIGVGASGTGPREDESFRDYLANALPAPTRTVTFSTSPSFRQAIPRL